MKQKVMYKVVRKGEIQPCSQCGVEYEHFTTNLYSACKGCRKKIYLAKNRLKPDQYKKNYPFNKNEQKKRYTRLRRELNKCETKEDRKEFYDKVLKEMEDTGIYLWCIDLRQSVKPKQKGRGYAGRNPKTITDPRLAYPDTRQMND